VRIVTQLIDAETGNHLWAERYDRALEDLFAVQDEITTAVVTAIIPAVADAELRRVLRKPPESLGAWEAYQRGLWHLWKGSAEEGNRALGLFEQAIKLDAFFAPAYSAMATAYAFEGAAYATRPLNEAAKLASDWALNAVEIDPNDAEAQATLAWTTAIEGNLEDASERASLALTINPNSTWASSVKGTVLIYSGRPSSGREVLLTALRLSPHDPRISVPLNQIAVSYYFEGNYQRALDAARRMVSRYPQVPLMYRYIAASLAQLGRIDEAQDALQEAVAVSPSTFALYTRLRPPWFRPEDHEHMLDGLCKAGWQR
jgi:adenylate cyclase